MNFRSPAARDEGLDESTICALATDQGTESLTDAEKAAIRFAELLAVDHRSIDDGVLDELRRHYGEPQIVEIGWAAGSFIAFGRLIHVFGGRWEGAPAERSGR